MTTSGVLPVRKSSGITSFDAIRVLRKKLGGEWKGLKTGHGGTLDPMATGVLPILVGEATKAFDFLLQSDKIYRALVQTGTATDTDDADGRVTAEGGRFPSKAEVESVLPRFTGRILQVPPRYSALRINGVRSYELAREDGGVELAPREVTVHAVDLLSFDEAAGRFEILVRCSSGTYIRAIARDIGAALGTCAHLASLERTRSGGIDLADCTDLDSIQPDNWKDLLIPLPNALSFLPPLELTVDAAYIMNGKPLGRNTFVALPDVNGICRAMRDGQILALVECRAGVFRYLRVFHDA
jgi:tRNA pseudouridine55 synthase